ncbi:hypothetical protein B0H14DRAFT_2586832 [Mycena olivaceomarginata]|nr:hypothetical protein B0H14DRAFT_2586832 [Mycena olivaceomarginata]
MYPGGSRASLPSFAQLLSARYTGRRYAFQGEQSVKNQLAITRELNPKSFDEEKSSRKEAGEKTVMSHAAPCCRGVRPGFLESSRKPTMVIYRWEVPNGGGNVDIKARLEIGRAETQMKMPNQEGSKRYIVMELRLGLAGRKIEKKKGPPSRVAVVEQENIETVHAPKHIQAAGALCMDRVAVLWSVPTAHRPREVKGPVPSRLQFLLSSTKIGGGLMRTSQVLASNLRRIERLGFNFHLASQ